MGFDRQVDVADWKYNVELDVAAATLRGDTHSHHRLYHATGLVQQESMIDLAQGGGRK